MKRGAAPGEAVAPPPRGPLWRPFTIVALASVWIAGPANWPLWRALFALPEMAGPRGLLFALGLGGMIAALIAALLSLLAWRYALKTAIALLLLSAAAGAHFMGSYGVVIDPTMMTNVLQTDARETRDLVGLPLLLSFALLAVLPIVALARARIAWPRWPRQALRNLLGLGACLAVLIALGLLAYQDLSSTMRNHKALRYLVNPVNSFYALGRLAWESQAHDEGPPTPIGLDARPLPPRPGQRPPLVLLAIGETARTDHFSLNGYGRSTNPELAAVHDVLSFRKVTSCGTNTAASLPCMLSALGRVAYGEREHDQENLLDLLQRAGLAVLWIENQAGCKEVCVRVPHTTAADAASGAAPPGEALCPGGECFDEALLHGLDARLAALPAEARARGVVLAMHQMGSHGPAYYRRTPPGRKPFTPECSSNALPQCEHQALINAYDNTIAYTDHVLAGTLAWLQHQQGAFDPSLLYLSDHGESLGENGLYLHGLPYAVAPREQKAVPMIAWLPPQTLAADALDLACLRGRLDAPLSHDNFFHTVLGLARVGASEYRRGLDALAPCRGG